MSRINIEMLVNELKGIEGDIWHMVKHNDPTAIMDRLRQVRKQLEPHRASNHESE